MMVVDDHPIFCDGLVSLLESWGCQIVGACRDPRQLLAQYPVVRPQLVISDFCFDESSTIRDGATLIRELLTIDPDAKVMILTGHADKLFLAECLDAGAAGYVTKSASAAEIREAVHAIAAGRAPVCDETASKLLWELARHEPRRRKLTAREDECARLLTMHFTDIQIAREMGIEVSTVKSFLKSLRRKFGVHRRSELIDVIRLELGLA